MDEDQRKEGQVSRREFFRSGGAAAVGVAVLPGAGLAAPAAEIRIPELDALGDSVGRTLMRMARDIFPHERVPDRLYAAAIAPYGAKASTEAKLGTLIKTGVAQLNAASLQRYGKAYADVPGEGERLAVLYSMEQSEFFQKIRGDMITGLYNNKEVWPLFGYEGSSWEKGGYLNRGFNDIDWL